MNYTRKPILVIFYVNQTDDNNMVGTYLNNPKVYSNEDM